jgi:hypothetical protein
MALQSLVGQGLHTVEASRSYSDTPHSVGLLWTSDHPDAETSTRQYTTFTKRQLCMPPAGFEPAILATERPQAHALHCAVTGMLLRNGGNKSMFSLLRMFS